MKIRSLLVALSTVAVTATTRSVAAPSHADVPGWDAAPYGTEF